MMNNNITQRRKLGALGEDLFCLLENCVRSTDPFDSVKDAVDSNGKNVEVKTQARYASKNLFTIRADKATNLNKCMTVDRLIFIEFDQSDTIGVFECTDRAKFVQYTTANGTRMLGWPIDGMLQLHSIKDTRLAEWMRSLSTSKYY